MDSKVPCVLLDNRITKFYCRHVYTRVRRDENKEKNIHGILEKPTKIIIEHRVTTKINRWQFV